MAAIVFFSDDFGGYCFHTLFRTDSSFLHKNKKGSQLGCLPCKTFEIKLLL